MASLFKTKTIETVQGKAIYYPLNQIESLAGVNLGRLPYCLRVLLENLLRHADGKIISQEDVLGLARFNPDPAQFKAREFAFFPARVLLQDFTGVPVVADLAAMREAVARAGGDPASINPVIAVDLVIDHSVQVDFFGSKDAFDKNVALEYQRNRERYQFLKWAQGAFKNFSLVPPGAGIVHQVNLEYLAQVVQLCQHNGVWSAYPDSLVGTDSHTTMVNGLGVVGWGVGGIEAEACMLNQPYYMLTPQVTGFKLTGRLAPGVTATDLVLTVTEMLRKHGVVDKFVEFYGPGLSCLSLPDRATLANMAPEYGATVGFFPIDQNTLDYLKQTGRSADHVAFIERYCKEQGLFRNESDPEPAFNETLQLDLARVELCVAGPKRPQDRVRLSDVPKAVRTQQTVQDAGIPAKNGPLLIGDGSVVIAAITSCTNTSNPSVLIAAGLLAKKAVERGLKTKPYVKTSLAPGSRVVTEYLRKSGLLYYLEQLNFHVVGYGCTTCIGNSGQIDQLDGAVAHAVKEHKLDVCAVLSGNRNFEGRINLLVRSSFLASPPLVVAYAIAGDASLNLTEQPLGQDQKGRDVYLKDIWPSPQEVSEVMARIVTPDLFLGNYSEVFNGDEAWRALKAPSGALYQWQKSSTYIQEPPFFLDLPAEPRAVTDIHQARALLVLGDSVTTDHISPAGSIAAEGPAGRYLMDCGVSPKEFNSFGARRGNHELMLRGSFANIRLRNLMMEGVEGSWTLHWPKAEKMSIYEAAERYKMEGVPLVVIAGRDYGSGSSRDWAAKSTALLGVRAVIAESFERIHRGNLVGMGVLPIEFKKGESRQGLGLTGQEIFDIEGPAAGLAVRQEVRIKARRQDGREITFSGVMRLDSAMDIEYYRHGGILPYVLRQMLAPQAWSSQGKINYAR